MLSRVTCSGFKSLVDFKFELRPGLNVMVGPNGSGKTNIFLLLQFLSALRRLPLVEAIGQVGGAGAVFRRNPDNSISKSIRLSVEGIGPFRRSQGSDDRVHYFFGASIGLSALDNAIVFESQQLFFKVLSRNVDGYDLDDNLLPREYEHAELKKKLNDFQIEWTLQPDGTMPITLGRVKKTLLRYFRDDPEVSTQIINDLCTEYGKSVSAFNLLDRVVPGANAISSDLSSLKPFNISPDKVRTPEDIGSPPTVASDGHGFAATLYALQSSQRITFGSFFPLGVRREFKNASEILERIKSFSHVINPSIINIVAQSDTMESKLKAFINLKYEGEDVMIPFSMVSDGTAKWFALITAIMTVPGVFAIEEPENFLHPTMQSEIVGLLRSQFYSEEGAKVGLITTHSETIINNAFAEEIIIVEMVDGRTIANRPSNAAAVAEEIKRTGFGLGFYYVSGAIE